MIRLITLYCSKVWNLELVSLARPWLSYLTNRSQRVSINGIVSDSFSLECGVPHGFCLGPLLFNIYVSKLFEIIKMHLSCNVHGFADDTQLYPSFKPDSCVSQEAAVIAMQSCIQDIHYWMLTDRLMLNVDKTEFRILGTRQQLAKVTTNDLTVGQDNISPVSEVKNLGCWFDNKLDMVTHINKICSA